MGATRYIMYIVKYGNDNNESTLIKGLMKSCSRLIKVDKGLNKGMIKDRSRLTKVNEDLTKG